MKKSSVIYEETRILTAKYYHPKSDDYLDYVSKIQIRDSGKNPVEMNLKFDGIPPFAAPMPPKEHTIKAPAILDLLVKVKNWFKKYGHSRIAPEKWPFSLISVSFPVFAEQVSRFSLFSKYNLFGYCLLAHLRHNMLCRRWARSETRT